MRNDIITEARSWIGTRWRHQGRNASGIDCVGLIIRVGNDLGIFEHECRTYTRRTVGKRFDAYFEEAGMTRLPFARAQPGDVVVTSDNSFPCHCGILTDKGFVHAYAARKRCLEEPIDIWRDRIICAMAWPGVT